MSILQAMLIFKSEFALWQWPTAANQMQRSQMPLMIVFFPVTSNWAMQRDCVCVCVFTQFVSRK